MMLSLLKILEISLDKLLILFLLNALFLSFLEHILNQAISCMVIELQFRLLVQRNIIKQPLMRISFIQETWPI